MRRLAWLLILFLTNAAHGEDVVIYGATPAGIAAAVSAAREGRSVLLIDPYRRIGGMMSNGLSHTDFHSFEGLNGAFLEHARRVQAHYVEKYGEDSPQTENWRGTHAEPHVNQLVFEQLLAEFPEIRVLMESQLTGVEFEGLRIRSIKISSKIRDAAEINSKGGESRPVEGLAIDLNMPGRVFIDASYEGDLMAAAQVEFRVGREGKDEYGESLAPDEPDEQVQGYNFRFCMTTNPENQIPVWKPEGYRREDFVAVLPLLGKPPVTSVFCDSKGGIYKAHPPYLPNAKADINDVSKALVRLSLPELSNGWPDGNQEARQAIFDAHVRHNVGLLYFLQNDEAVPAEFREDARRWAFCEDEFAESNHIPEQLYIREGRRMVGDRVYTENDTAHAPGDARAVLHSDSIAIGEYSHNCHGTSHPGPVIGGSHEGEFYKPVPPYQIPYAILTPKNEDCENLLVPIANSSSHVGFCALRLEPIWMSLGQASGFAAALAVEEEQPVQKIDIARLQQLLRARGGKTIYVSDVLPGHPDFEAVQWWGTHGGLHGLEPAPEKSGQRGEHIFGQYFEAYPGHEAQLDAPLDEETRLRWLKLTNDLGIVAQALGRVRSRGEFIRVAWKQRD